MLHVYYCTPDWFPGSSDVCASSLPSVLLGLVSVYSIPCNCTSPIYHITRLEVADG